MPRPWWQHYLPGDGERSESRGHMNEIYGRHNEPTNGVISQKWDLLLVGVIYGLLFNLAWIGYIGSDDAVYILNARNRVLDPFSIGMNHWDVRVTLTWPMALSFLAFGESELAAALPTLAYTFATGLCVHFYLKGRTDRVAALSAAILLASSPLLAVNATSLRIDAVETFYVISSLIVLMVAIERRGAAPLVLLAGVLAGLAFVTRPTTVALLAFYGLLFLFGYQIERRRYLLIAAGFLSVWLTESFCYLAGTGDFFHRLSVDFNHDKVVRGTGLLESVLIAPIKMLWGSHSLGFAFWFLPVAAWQLLRNGAVPTTSRSIASFLTLFSIIWVVTFSAFASKLVLDPRYLAPAAAAALVVTALWISALIRLGKARWAVTIFLLCLGSHALAIYMENKDFSYAERWLVNLAQRAPEPIYTDPQTSERARFLLEVSGLRNRVIPEPAPPGALFLAVPENNSRGRYNQYQWDPTTYSPGLWQEVDKLSPERKEIGLALEAIGLQHAFPPHVWRKLDHPNPPITLFRRP